jgi:hypothetical protein
VSRPMRVSASQLAAFSVRPTSKSLGSLIVVSVRRARPSLRYCLTLVSYPGPGIADLIQGGTLCRVAL